MTLSRIDLRLLTDVAVDAATQASALIQQHLGAELEVSRKTGGSLASQVLTVVDQLSQDLILETLKPATERYELGTLAEEQADDQSRFTRPYFWCIDPIDGTLPFIEGGPGCAVSIALVSQAGEPLVGVVSDPCESILYRATAGQGVHRNGQLWSVRQGCALTFVCDRSFLGRPEYALTMSRIAEIAAQLGCDGVELISHGGAVLNACWVIEHAPACYFKVPRAGNSGGSIWDYAATACIFRELGATCSDAFGDPLELNRKGSTYLNHRGLLFASSNELAAHLISPPPARVS